AFAGVAPQARRVIGADDDFVNACLWGQERSRPADGKLIGLELLRVGTGSAEVEGDRGIDALDGPIVIPEATRFEVFAAQAALLVARCGAAEAADQVGHRLAILTHGEARQFEARRLVAFPGGSRIEGVVDVGGDLLGVLAGAFLLRVLGHRASDEASQLGHRALTRERMGVVVASFALRSMARGALLSVNLLSRPVLRGERAGR